ncbi:MAG TPA: alpha/beta hydrolase, partial [Dokdonella sp.]|nr:alpha/beta hydrolase [Dokdonella sp.]
AVLQSGYSQPGWAIEQGSADSERLRRWFVARHGKPGRTIAMGMSMGGALTVHALETNPRAYDGGLSLCGAIEPSDRMMQRDFAVRAAFDYYFPGVLGELVPVAADFVADDATAARIAAAMRANPGASASLRAIYGAGDMDNLPGVIAAITYDVKEMQQRTRGNPFGNADLVYTGSVDDDALNDGVRRYRSEPKAAAYMARWYTPTGELTRPLLALHDTRDPLVVASSAFEYALLVQRAGHADRFVQQYVKHEGHCVFTPAQIGKAFDSLLEWMQGGRRPRSGAQP